MTPWNYRVIKTKDGMVGIGEVIYEGVDKIVGWIHPRDVSLYCEDYEWLKWDIEHMAQALTRPVLVETDNEELIENDHATENDNGL